MPKYRASILFDAEHDAEARFIGRHLVSAKEDSELEAICEVAGATQWSFKRHVPTYMPTASITEEAIP